MSSISTTSTTQSSSNSHVSGMCLDKYKLSKHQTLTPFLELATTLLDLYSAHNDTTKVDTHKPFPAVSPFQTNNPSTFPSKNKQHRLPETSSLNASSSATNLFTNTPSQQKMSQINVSQNDTENSTDTHTSLINQMRRQLRDSEIAYMCLSRAYAKKTQDLQAQHKAQLEKLETEYAQSIDQKKSTGSSKRLQSQVASFQQRAESAETDLKSVLAKYKSLSHIVSDLRSENIIKARQYRSARRAEAEYTDLAAQFQAMLAEYQTKSVQKMNEVMAELEDLQQKQQNQQNQWAQSPPSPPLSPSTLSSSSSSLLAAACCSRCKFVRHTEAMSTATTSTTVRTLNRALKDFRTSCSLAAAKVKTLHAKCEELQDEQARTQKRADYWMAKFLETNCAEAKAARLQLRFQQQSQQQQQSKQNHDTNEGRRTHADDYQSLQSVITRPECQFESLEDTLKASKFWLRPLNKLSSGWAATRQKHGPQFQFVSHRRASLRRLSTAISTPNLRGSGGMNKLDVGEIAEPEREAKSDLDFEAADNFGFEFASTSQPQQPQPQPQPQPTLNQTVFNQGLATPSPSPVMASSSNFSEHSVESRESTNSKYGITKPEMSIQQSQPVKP